MKITPRPGLTCSEWSGRKRGECGAPADFVPVRHPEAGAIDVRRCQFHTDVLESAGKLAR